MTLPVLQKVLKDIVLPEDLQKQIEAIWISCGLKLSKVDFLLQEIEKLDFVDKQILKTKMAETLKDVPMVEESGLQKVGSQSTQPDNTSTTVASTISSQSNDTKVEEPKPNEEQSSEQKTSSETISTKNDSVEIESVTDTVTDSTTKPEEQPAVSQGEIQGAILKEGVEIKMNVNVQTDSPSRFEEVELDSEKEEGKRKPVENDDEKDPKKQKTSL